MLKTPTRRLRNGGDTLAENVCPRLSERNPECALASFAFVFRWKAQNIHLAVFRVRQTATFEGSIALLGQSCSPAATSSCFAVAAGVKVRNSTL